MNETKFTNYATVLISITFIVLQIGLMNKNGRKFIKKKNSTLIFYISIVMILLFLDTLIYFNNIM